MLRQAATRVVSKRLYATSKAASTSSSSSSTYSRPLKVGQLPAYDHALEILQQHKELKQKEFEQWKAENADAKEGSKEFERRQAQIMEFDPETRWKAQNNQGDMSQAVYRHLAEQSWRNNGELAILMQRVTQMFVTPDVLPNINPQARLDISVDGQVIEPGSYTKPAATRDGISLSAQTFHKDERLYTLLIVDPDVPDEARQSFTTFAHLLVPNIPLSATQTSLSGEPTLPFIPPHPQNGTPYHRYTVLLLSQPKQLSLDSESIERLGFNVRSFVEEYGLECVGVNFTRQKWDQSVSEIYEKVLGLPEPFYGRPPRLDTYEGRPAKHEIV